MKKIKVFLALCTLFAFSTCKQNNANIFPSFLNKDVSIVLNDKLVLLGNENLVFSDNLSIFDKNKSSYKLFDNITKTIIIIKTSKVDGDKIEKQINLSKRFEKHSGFVQNLLGVKKVLNHQFILISYPYSIVVDSEFNYVEEILFKPELENKIYNPAGTIDEICFNENKNALYFPVFPDIPYTHNEYFDEGRIVEVNLDNKKNRVLPAGLPNDYKPGNNYGFFSLAFIAVFDNFLYYIFNGSNTLYKMNLTTEKKDAIILSPQHAKISATHLSGNIFEQIAKQAECNTFYRIIKNKDILMLFYREGITKGAVETINEGTGRSNQYVMGYSLNTNEVLYDIPLSIEQTYNEPVFNHSGLVYFLKTNDWENENAEIKETFLKYKFIIQ